LRDQFTETGDLSNLLEEDGRSIRSVAVDTNTCGVVDKVSGLCTSWSDTMNHAYRQSHNHGIRVERDRCRGLRKCAFCPSHTSTSSMRRFLQDLCIESAHYIQRRCNDGLPHIVESVFE
jgi:hypothetical protein